MGVIYKHTLLADCEHKGGSYIGQTCREDYNRRGVNGFGYAPSRGNSPTIFWKAICKYGGDNFSHEIIESNIATQEEANEREIYGIAYYHTGIADPERMGYNMTPGGAGKRLSRIKLINDETQEIKGGYSDYLDSYQAEGFRQGTYEDWQKSFDYAEQHRQRNREGTKRKLASMTSEELEEYREKHCKRNKKIREKKSITMTEAEKEQERAKQREYIRNNKERRNAQTRQRYKEKLAAMTPEELEAYKEKRAKANKKYNQARMDRITAEELEAFKQRKRDATKRYREKKKK